MSYLGALSAIFISSVKCTSTPSATLIRFSPCHHADELLAGMPRSKTDSSSVLQYELDHTSPSTLALTPPSPLFVHSNLLKHLNGFGIPHGPNSLFTHIKRVASTHDAYDDPLLNYAHQAVYYGNRGMCIDIEWRDFEGDSRGAEIELVKVEEVDGWDVGFEQSFWELGGRMGGW